MFNNHKTNRGQKSSIFPQKLWRMVNDSELDSAIKWNYDGRSFMVNENPLKNMCLGKENKLFYTKQPKSFVRQLHLYGFRKISKNQFSHQYFLRDQPELLKNIRRSYKPQPISNFSTSDKSESTSSSNGGNQTDENNAIEVLPCRAHSTNKGGGGEPNRQPKIEFHHQELNSITTDNSNFEVSTSSAVTASHSIAAGLFDQQQQQEQFAMIGADIDLITSNQLGYHSLTSLSPSNGGALAFANNYDASCAPPLSWYETNYSDINNYNYNDDNILTLYNNDIYPDTCDDNNVTL